MALIVPTVETIGDEMLTNSLVEKTCEELQDTAVSGIGYHAFYDNKVIKKVVFGAAVSLGVESFRGCKALSAADFHKLTSIKADAFYGCSSLETLIIRTPSVCSMYSDVSLSKTPIANGTGYIYVPAALVDSYKNTSPWNTYANQIRAIEEWPEVCSTAGKAWEQSNATSDNQYHVVYANGLFICLGSSCKYYSVDGKTWKSDAQGPSKFSDEGHPIRFANGLWVLGERGKGLWHSEDGITWTQSNITGTYVTSVAYGNGMWVASDRTKVYYSADGKTWSEGSPSGIEFMFIIYGDGMFVAGSDGSGLYYSEDGVSWSASNITTGTYEYFGDYANGLFVIPGISSTKNVLVSADGKTWQELSVIESYKRPTFETIVHKNGLWVGGARNATGIWYSEDGQTWSRSNVSSGSFYRVDYGASVFASVGNLGCYYSADGKNWEKASGGSSRCERIAFGGDCFVACTSDASYGIYYSE